MLFFLVLLLGAWSVNCKTSNEKAEDVTVELGIFCDMEFGEFFQHNETKIREYWATRIWDVNLRFQTLPSLGISFRVTSLYVFDKKIDQSFIEETRNSSGIVGISRSLTNFSKWVHQLTRQNQTFDVALLVMGAKISSELTGSYDWRQLSNGACRSHSNGQYFGTVVLAVEKEILWNNCGELENALGGVLGAQMSPRINTAGCTDWTGRLRGTCNKAHFFFSECSDEGILNYVGSNHATCLHSQIAPEEHDIFPTELFKKKPPTFEEQCKLRLGNSSAAAVVVNQGHEPCVEMSCCLGNSSQCKIYPMDNTPCDKEKSCFRGRCIQDGFQLVNVGSGKCLHSSDRFASNDNPQMVNCHAVTTPLDQVMILNKGDSGLYLATPYSTRDATENWDKCLTTAENKEIIYEKCPTDEHDDKFGWELVEMNEEGKEVKIIHKNSQHCLAVSRSDILFASPNCSIDSTPFKWKFSGTGIPPRHLFKKSPQIIQYSNQPTFKAVVNSAYAISNPPPTTNICIVFSILAFEYTMTHA